MKILFQLLQIILIPYNLIMAPFRAMSSMFTESGRSRSLLFGLPAVITAILGISALAWAEYGNRDNLEETYSTRAEKVGDEKDRLFKALSSEQRIGASRERNADGSRSNVVSKDDPRILQLRKLHSAEEIYLNKLISLNPDEPDFRYRLALVALQMGDTERCYSLMKSIAPDDEPGYAKAHYWIARNYVNQRAKSPSQRRQYLALALKHTEHCLVRDKTNNEAKILKAGLLANDKRLVEALNVYDELLIEDPRFYKPIVEINRKLGQESKNAIVLDQAQIRFQEAVSEASKTYSEDWSRAWINLTVCLREKKDFALATKKLLEEEATQAKLAETEETPEATSRHIHIKQLLTQIYTDWAAELAETDAESGDTRNESEQLDLLKEAIKFDPDNSRALQLVARISAGDSALADEARKIYNPEEHDDAPATVLNEMGSRSMQKEQYDLAIKYFELARRKAPNDPQILNNLAYTYLVCENKNPDRALQLVNQAIRGIQNISNPQGRLMLASHFYDTRGRALMQMNRMDEAAAALEMAMQVRPENEEILEALIQCYEGRDDLQAEVYRKRLEEIRAKKAEESTTDSPGN